MDVPSQIRRTCQSEDAKGKLYIFYICLIDNAILLIFKGKF